MTRRNSIAVSLLIFFAGLVAPAQTPATHIYSSVEYNKEGGDLLGFELQLTINGTLAKGQLKVYEGGCAVPNAVSGSLQGNRVELRVLATMEKFK